MLVPVNCCVGHTGWLQTSRESPVYLLVPIYLPDVPSFYRDSRDTNLSPGLEWQAIYSPSQLLSPCETFNRIKVIEEGI